MVPIPSGLLIRFTVKGTTGPEHLERSWRLSGSWGDGLWCHWQGVKSVRTTLSRWGVRIENVLREVLDSTPRRSGGRGGA